MAKEIKIEDADELQELRTGRDDPDFPFVALDIKRLTSAGRNVNCDIYIRISDSKMTRVFSQDSGLDFIRLRQYIDKGVKEIFVRKEDMEKFNQYLQNAPDSVFANDLASQEQKMNALLDQSEQTVADFFSKVPLADVSVEKTKVIIRRMMQTLMRDPAMLAALIRMSQHHDFMLSHSIAVSVFSMLIARGAQNANERTLELCGVGGFLHDIGKTQISKEIVPKYSNMSPEQWKEMRHHPLLGVKMLERCQNVPDEVKLIIMQHHEQPGGSGYPSGMRGPKIFYPAKIVAIADLFSALISGKSTNKPYAPDEALNEMQQDPGKFDRDLLNITIEMFRLRK